MCSKVKKILSGTEIIKQKVLIINAILPSPEYILISGFVHSPTGKPLPNCAIAVNIIDNNMKPPKKIFLGATFTTEDGYYGISVKRYEKYSYELKAYYNK